MFVFLPASGQTIQLRESLAPKNTRNLCARKVEGTITQVLPSNENICEHVLAMKIYANMYYYPAIACGDPFPLQLASRKAFNVSLEDVHNYNCHGQFAMIISLQIHGAFMHGDCL